MNTDFTIADVIASATWVRDCMDTDKGTNARDPRFTAMHDAYWTCAACGCRSQPRENDLWAGLQIHHKDDNPLNECADNLVCVCPLCHGLLHLDTMLIERLHPGHFIWAPSIRQSFLTLFAHVRAVVEERCADHLARGVVTPDRARSADQRLELEIRETLAATDAALRRLRLPEGVFLYQAGNAPPAQAGAGARSGPAARSGLSKAHMSPALQDMMDLVEDNPVLFGHALRSFVRTASPAERLRTARALHGLRYVFAPGHAPWAAAYAGSVTWAAGRDWAKLWLEDAGIVLQRLADMEHGAKSAAKPAYGPGWDKAEDGARAGRRSGAC